MQRDTWAIQPHGAHAFVARRLVQLVRLTAPRSAGATAWQGAPF
jgi:hypothetical protein